MNIDVYKMFTDDKVEAILTGGVIKTTLVEENLINYVIDHLKFEL